MTKWSPERLAELQKKFPPEYPEVLPKNMLRIREFDWSAMTHRYLTCVVHPWARWLTKNPFERSIFFLQGPNGLPDMLDEECECPFQDMRVVKGE